MLFLALEMLADDMLASSLISKQGGITIFSFSISVYAVRILISRVIIKLNRNLIDGSSITLVNISFPAPVEVQQSVKDELYDMVSTCMHIIICKIMILTYLKTRNEAIRELMYSQLWMWKKWTCLIVFGRMKMTPMVHQEVV